MKAEYYADKRDIVKWAGILNLCQETGIKHVIQVAYFRKPEWPKLYFNDKVVDIPDEVLNHFRDIKDIKRMGKKAGIDIQVIDWTFEPAYRTAYHGKVCENILKQTASKIVFLDPDTGLAPKNTKAEHVKSDEMLQVWQYLKKGDFLVFYQHFFRDVHWVETRRKQIAQACNIKENTIKQWKAPEIASDVVFYYFTK